MYGLGLNPPLPYLPRVLLSLHLPKSGGTSFRQILEDHFRESFQSDYGDRPLNMSLAERMEVAERFRAQFDWSTYRGVQCIHGHFMPIKYSVMEPHVDMKYVTWMRDPLARMESHYRFWKKMEFQLAENPNQGALRRRVFEEKWSLEEFCFSEELQNFYAQFLRGFELERFSFIGITEHFQYDIADFGTCFNIPIPKTIPQENVNEAPSNSIIHDDVFRREFMAYHRDDYRLYYRALELRAQRCNAKD